MQHEERSLHSPCLTGEGWAQRLHNSGFSGIDVEFSGHELEECRYSTIFVSTAIKPDLPYNNRVSPVMKIAQARYGHRQAAISEILRESLSSECMVPCNIYSLQDLAAQAIISNASCVILDSSPSILANITELEYQSLHRILNSASSIHWVTAVPADEDPHPTSDMVYGLARVLRSEDPERKFVVISFDDSKATPTESANMIAKIIEESARHDADDVQPEDRIRDRVARINRLVESEEMNEAVPGRTAQIERRSQCLSDGSLELRLGAPRQLESLHWRGVDVESTTVLAPDEVLVRVRAIGLTIEDRLVVQGRADHTSLGSECAGVIELAGAQTLLRPGDRTCLIGLQTSCTHVRCKASSTVRIPNDWSFEVAASFPNSTWLAYHALVNVARLEREETVLVYDGASAVGQVTIQLAQKLGAHVFTTATKPSDREFLRRTLDLPQHRIFLSTYDDMVDYVRQATKEIGMDVIIDPRESASLRNLNECLAPFGRLVDLAWAQDTSPNTVLASTRSLNQSITTVNLREMLLQRPVQGYQTFVDAVHMAIEQNITPSAPLHVFQGDSLCTAFKPSHCREDAGKVSFHQRQLIKRS